MSNSRLRLGQLLVYDYNDQNRRNLYFKGNIKCITRAVSILQMCPHITSMLHRDSSIEDSWIIYYIYIYKYISHTFYLTSVFFRSTFYSQASYKGLFFLKMPAKGTNQGCSKVKINGGKLTSSKMCPHGGAYNFIFRFSGLF